MDKRLSPGFARGTYSGLTSVHHWQFGVRYDGTPTAGVEPTLLTKDGSSISGEDGVNAFLNEFKKLFHTSTLFGLVEFYSVDADTGEGTFLYAFNAGMNGASASENVPFGQAILTYKAVSGLSIKIYAMEGIAEVNEVSLPPYPVDSPPADLSDFITGDTSIVYGRSNTYAFAPISFRTKTNDVLRKRGQG